jgi:hypothetical protein
MSYHLALFIVGSSPEITNNNNNNKLTKIKAIAQRKVYNMLKV